MEAVRRTSGIWSKVIPALLFGFLLFWAQPAHAQSCGLSVSDMAFGTTTAGAQTNGTGAVTLFCNGTPNQTLLACVYVGAGSGGSGGSGPRMMLSGLNPVNFDIYTTSAYTTRYATGFVAGANPARSVPLDSSGSGIVSIILYGRISAGQSTTVPGNYSSTFSADTQVDYGYNTTFTSCSSALAHSTGSYSFFATATIQSACSINTTPVAFASTSALTNAVDAAGSVGVTCTSGLSYTIALNGGHAKCRYGHHQANGEQHQAHHLWVVQGRGAEPGLVQFWRYDGRQHRHGFATEFDDLRARSGPIDASPRRVYGHRDRDRILLSRRSDRDAQIIDAPTARHLHYVWVLR